MKQRRKKDTHPNNLSWSQAEPAPVLIQVGTFLLSILFFPFKNPKLFLILLLIIGSAITGGFLFMSLINGRQSNERSRNFSSTPLPAPTQTDLKNTFDFAAIEKDCNDFSIRAGNIEEANTILIGENHHSRSSTNKCINALTKSKRKHLVLLEGVINGTQVSCEKYGISNHLGRTCIGMDEQKSMIWLNNKINKQYYETTMGQFMVLYKKFLPAETSSLTLKEQDIDADKKFSAYLKNLQRDLFNEYEILLKKYKRYQPNDYPDNMNKDLSQEEQSFLDRKRKLEFLDSLQKKRLQHTSYTSLFMSYWNEINNTQDHNPNKSKKNLQKIMLKRTRLFFSTAEKYQNDYGLILIPQGLGHIRNDSSGEYSADRVEKSKGKIATLSMQ